MSTPGQQPSEAELKALEEQMAKVRIEDVIVQVAVDLLNLTAMRSGLARQPGDETPPDWSQVGRGIDAVTGLLATIEDVHGPKLGQIKDALAQIRLAYARSAPRGAQVGDAPAPAADPAAPAGQQPPAPGPESPRGPGSAQQSGRLWIPGQ